MTESSRAAGRVPFDPRAVIEGRAPGRTPVALIVGTAITAACAIVALGIDAAQSFAVGAGPPRSRSRCPWRCSRSRCSSRSCSGWTGWSRSRAPTWRSRSAGAPGSPPSPR